MGRTGRRPGATQTREQILEAAREQFAEMGYNGATIRGIARRAGVDPALVHHFFGAKDQVFIAAMQLPYNPADVVRRLVTAPGPDRAEALVRFFFDIWERPETRTPMVAMLRSATTHDHAATTVREFMSHVLQRHIAAEVGISPVRAGVVASQLFGLVVIRYVIGVEPLASASVEELVRICEPAISAILDAPEPDAGDDSSDGR